MATPDTWDLAQTDAPPPPPPSAAPAAAADPTSDYIRQQLALLQAPLPSVQPDTTPVKRGWLSLLGEAIGGGTTTDAMSPAQRERAGLRALGDFGTSLMAGSGYYPGKPMFGGLAQGFEGASRSEAGSEQQAASYLGAQQNWQMEQQKLQLERLKEAMPLLQMQYGASIPNPLLANAPVVPGTAGGAGKPGGGGIALGMRQNNPLNLTFAGQPGAQPGQGNRFATFSDLPSGVAATADQLALYQTQHGINTVQDAVKRWVSDPKADLTSYTADVANALGVKPTDKIDLTDPAVQQKFILAAQPHESGGGGATLNPADVAKGVQLAAANRGQTAQAPPAPYQVAGKTVAPPSGSTAAPADTTATTADATPPPPGGQLTFEQFQAQHPIAINAADYTVTPPGLAEAQSAMAAAKLQLTAANRKGDDAGAAKAVEAYNTANDRASKLQQDAQAKSLELQQAAQKNALDTQRQLYGEEQQRQQQAKLKADELTQAAKLKADELAQAAQLKQQELAQTAAENQRNRDAEIEKAKLASGYTIQQEQAKADMDIAKTDLNDRAADAQKAGRVIPILQQMQGQIGKMPDGFIGGLLAKYDTTGDMTGILAKMGVVDPTKATAAQMLIAARNYLSIEMKPAATGSLRVAEMDKLQSFTPGQLQTPEAQNEMAARLIAYQKRIQDERSFASTYFGRQSDPNNPNSPRIYDNRNLDKAMNAPVKYDQNGNVTGGGLGPVVPEPPSANAPDAEHQAYLNYVNRNLAPGAPYQAWEPKRNQDGSLALDANRRPIPQRVTKLKVYQ
jgi:hypothetical protein